MAMTQDEIIKMAIGIGLKYRKDNNEIYTPDCDGIHIDELQLFSELVAQHEREEIAQFIEQTRLGSLPREIALHYATLLGSYATAIRAKGKA